MISDVTVQDPTRAGNAPEDNAMQDKGQCDRTTAMEKANPLHRIKQVRLNEGLSLRAMARRMNTTISDLKAQEDERADLRLSELYRWQEELRVPARDLLVEPEDDLSDPVYRRASLIRLAKTAKALARKVTSPTTRRLADNLVEQLTCLMPELEEIGPWHECGQRRSLDEPSRLDSQVVAVQRLLSDARDCD
jgi:transcriptional regulator with XRE-family HTH domain